LKFSKHVETSDYFSYRPSNNDKNQILISEPRSDFAKIVSEDCEILEING